MTFEEYLHDKLAPATIKSYSVDVNNLIIYLTPKRTTKASYEDLEVYVNQLREGGYSSGYLKKVVNSLMKYFDYLVTTQQRKDNPCVGIKLKDKVVSSVQLQDLFKPKELELLMNRTDPYPILRIKNQALTSLMIYQGLLVKEMFNLRLGDIDLNEGTIYISSTSKSNERMLKLQPKQVMLFYKYIHEVRPALRRGESNYLLINQRGKPVSGLEISYLLKPMKSMFTDRKLSPMTIKMSVISNLLRDGNNLREVQYYGGYRKVSSVELYRQQQVEELKNVILRMHPY
ncbi:tyrosine-type recombinase/integrase [Fulvivirga sp.]|uniref:tyrosine-type recombinase/integrase n=1 Tax=Fulvivirga sp. TaxID=1931237 RepID=UPI0032F0121D